MEGALAPAKAAKQETSEKRQRYITPREVSLHNRPDDCWVSFLGRVYNITAVIESEEDNRLTLPIINRAGSDISDWFDLATGDIRRHLDAVTNLEMYYTPMGRFVGIPLCKPVTDTVVANDTPWWKDKKYYIGELATKTQMIRIRNVLTNQEAVMEVKTRTKMIEFFLWITEGGQPEREALVLQVPEDELMAEIRERYLTYNSHAKSYTFKTMLARSGSWIWKDLLMDKTLAENGIENQATDFVKCKLLRNHYIPVIHAYFNDDLTVS